MVDNSYAVLILGAGASKEYNLPLGSELKDKIAKLLDFRFEHSNRPSKGDSLVFDAIGTHQQDFPRQVEVVNKLIIAGREIIDALPQAPSIDQFIFNRSSQTDIATIGKIAIARAIQQAERESKLNVFGEGRYASPEKGFKDWKISDTWLPRLFSIIVDGCASFNELEVRLKKIKVISFNYDRVFLHFLYHALNNYYPGKSNEIVSALCALDVIRPYGSIGPLNWENERDGVHYGGNLDGLTLALLASKILTFNESVDDKVQLKAHNCIENASLVMFLGFGFHDQNMRFLEQKCRKEVRIFGTARGFSDFDKQMIIGDICKKFGVNSQEVLLYGGDCSNIFSEYSRALRLVGI